MTEVTVLHGDDGNVIGLRGNGHSGSEPSGQNIVCASITTVFEFLSQGASQYPDSSFTFQQDPEIPRWRIEFMPENMSDSQLETMRSFLAAAIGVVNNIAEQYPDRCRLND
ncbi:MAG: ribosomal-processing cysteine protease Prp [bacterium]